MIAGDFLTPSFSDAPTTENTMALDAGKEFEYSVNYNFRSSGNFNLKFLGTPGSTIGEQVLPLARLRRELSITIFLSQ